MILTDKTITKLRELINEETEYRSGPNLVKFFNDLGFEDSYGQGFPSRWFYTDEKLKKINGTPELDTCIKNLFSPINFINKIKDLDNLISNFNQYLAFDGWEVKRDGKEIIFVKSKGIEWLKEKNDFMENKEEIEKKFLEKEFNNIKIDELGLDLNVVLVIKERIDEIKNCLTSNSPLSVIFLSGSTLEGILLGIALRFPNKYNTAKSSPKYKDGSVKKFPDWNLNNLIDVSYEINFIKEDIKKFSHVLRDFRNYIHPYQQMSSGFSPSQQTAEICFQVLKASIFQLKEVNKL